MNRRGFLVCAGALAVAGCASQPLPRTAADPSELEAVYAITPERDGLVVRVASNGCTSRADFAFYVDRKGALPSLAFGRRRLDTCRSFAAGRADLIFTWQELGLAPTAQFALLNPLTTAPGL